MSTVDLITTEVIRNAFSAIASEMNDILIRSAYSPIIYEGKDCAVGLLDEDHRILGQSNGIALFIGNLEAATEYTERVFGRDVWQPGDIWVVNDPYVVGTHLNDVTVYGPIFIDDELIGFGASRAHWLDMGSAAEGGGTNATQIYSEGLLITPIKVVEGGVERRDVSELFAHNSRFPTMLLGDLGAQIACMLTGQRRLEELARRFGVETVRAARDEIFRQSETFERGVVREIPDGNYRADGFMDSNGIGESSYSVDVQITISGEQFRVDLSASDDLQEGPVNCGLAQTIAAVRMAYKLLVNPRGSLDGGCFAPLEVVVREGSFLHAEEPYPCQWYFSSLGLVIDLILKAMSTAMPAVAIAAHYGDVMSWNFGGTDPETGEYWYKPEPNAGGWGGSAHADGEHAMWALIQGEIKDFPVEVIEAKYPIDVLRYELRSDSGGAGQHPGGCGVVREFRMRHDGVRMTTWLERRGMPAWGVLGGQEGAPPDVVVRPGSDTEAHPYKATGFPLSRGDVVRVLTGGGGGYGDPAERSRDDIEADIADRLLTPEGARRKYGYIA